MLEHLKGLHLFYRFHYRFYLVLELLHNVSHHPVVIIQYVSLSKLKVTVEVSRPQTLELLLPVQDDLFLLRHTDTQLSQR